MSFTYSKGDERLKTAEALAGCPLEEMGLEEIGPNQVETWVTFLLDGEPVTATITTQDVPSPHQLEDLFNKIRIGNKYASTVPEAERLEFLRRLGKY